MIINIIYDKLGIIRHFKCHQPLTFDHLSPYVSVDNLIRVFSGKTLLIGCLWSPVVICQFDEFAAKSLLSRSDSVFLIWSRVWMKTVFFFSSITKEKKKVVFLWSYFKKKVAQIEQNMADILDKQEKGAAEETISPTNHWHSKHHTYWVRHPD